MTSHCPNNYCKNCAGSHLTKDCTVRYCQLHDEWDHDAEQCTNRADNVVKRRQLWMYQMTHCIKCDRYGHVAKDCEFNSWIPLTGSLLKSNKEEQRFKPKTNRQLGRRRRRNVRNLKQRRGLRLRRVRRVIK